MDTPQIINIGSDEVKRILKNHLSDFLKSLELALASFSSKDDQVIQPVRIAIPVSEHNGLKLVMPAYSRTEDAITTKVVTVYPDNSKVNLPAIQANVFLFAPETGTLKAVIEGNSLTATRTAAASLIATKYLSEKPKILALLGSGVQARSHFALFSEYYPDLHEVRIWNHRLAGAEQLVTEIKAKGFLKVIACQEAEDAVNNADVIVTSTLSTTPVLKGAWVKEGAHVNAVGACDPTWREMDDELMKKAIVYVDSREAAPTESGDIILSKAEVFAELGEIILAKREAHNKKTTIFKSLGMAIEDTIAANLVYKHRNQPCSICDN